MQSQPLTNLRDRFEGLDLKLLTDYNIEHTTHVVAKKRNTAKGLQALINGRHIVTESYLDAIAEVAGSPDAGADAQAAELEQDFFRYWPKPAQHLPPPGGEPVQHEDPIYEPDAGRRDIFEGYTFIFYDRTQYSNLLAPITNGGGKALLETIEVGSTSVDDYVRYVKSVAGEKGLGSFDDGSEGKGVVLVRHIPFNSEHLAWYVDFVTRVSLLLDHRPIEQNEFLEAILIKDASILRRPLEVESTPAPADSAGQTAPATRASTTRADRNRHTQQDEAQASGTPQVTVPRRGARVPVKRRFAGFAGDDDHDDSIVEPSVLSVPSAQPRNDPPDEEEGGLFVSQAESQRGATPSEDVLMEPETDLLEGMTAGAARYKRQKTAHGLNSIPPSPEPEEPVARVVAPKKKAKKNIDVMELAAQQKREEEARARAEEEDLAILPDDIDLAEIRKLNIVEEMPVRQPASAVRGRERDVAVGRWKPEWNGMQNFKKFRRRGATVGREPARIIVGLTQVKAKEFGLGDDYWFDDEKSPQQGSASATMSMEKSLQLPSAGGRSNSSRRQQDSRISATSESAGNLDGNHNSSDESVPDVSTVQSRSTRQSVDRESQRKRAAADPPASAASRSSKRQRQTPARIEIKDSDEDEGGESDDELNFRFGRRRA